MRGRQMPGAGSNDPSRRDTRLGRRDRNRVRHSRGQGRRRTRSARATAALVSSMSFSFVSPSKVAPIRVVSNTRIACDQHRIVFGPICASGSRSDLSRAIPPGAIPSGAIPCGADPGVRHRAMNPVLTCVQVQRGTVIQQSRSIVACRSGYGAAADSEITYWGLTALQ